MSEANDPMPGTGGPISRPDGNGLPPIQGGRKPPGGEDLVDPAPGDADFGGDAPGMAGEG